MRVSVVCPTRNREPVLGDAIESVLAQTHGDLELLVVDGGSTDGTRGLVESVDDDRVRYLRNEAPEGVSAARNDGVQAAGGELVAFVDSDDRWRADKLERQVAAYERAPDACGAVYCGIEKDGYGEPLTRGGASGDVEAELREMAVPTYTSTLLVERDALLARGGFDEALPCFEDWDLCLRLAEECTFRFVDAPLVVKGSAGDNVSADHERLAAAADRLRDKHDLPRGTRARLLADVGVTACEAGALAFARPYLRRALRLDPRQLNTAVALALSYTGSPALFDRLMWGLYAAERRLARGIGA